MEQNFFIDKIDFESTILALFDSATLLNLQKTNKKMFKNRTSFGSLGLSKKNQADITVDLKQQ